MIIECGNCEAKVDGIEIGEVKYNYKNMNRGGLPNPHQKVRAILLQCPACKWPILAEQSGSSLTAPKIDKWKGTLRRIYPPTETSLDYSIPRNVRVILQEARDCFNSKVFNACATMCGRVLEEICVYYKTKSSTIYRGIQELKDRKIIDDTIYQWADLLRQQRNIGAHADPKKFNREDAQDLLDFTIEICNYIFVMKMKFDSFVERDNKQKNQ